MAGLDSTNGSQPVVQQKQFINNVGNLIDQLNEQRMNHADQGEYINADTQLQNIQIVRKHAQKSIKDSLVEKHVQEAEQVEYYNREEFQEFTLQWDNRMDKLRLSIAEQVLQMQKDHKRQQLEMQ